MLADIHKLVYALSLADIFGITDDTRNLRGKRYTLSFLLNSTACAMMSGAQGFVQIAEWICAQPLSKLKNLGNLRDTHPDESTIRKTFSKIKLADFQRHVYGWFDGSTEYHALAVDGKTLKSFEG
ncbi:MAG TPA: transposase family protein [Oligoflexus sp.]|uniref:transposase family protein n=1 Tax=Oligoflexus sp. TaxID=1971216 RepID=UPI002D4A733B|nr:transposase family protein [Oligoflexus sp.]HYX33709.1 transposase family protein [Oligoflexus sp.]